MILLIYLAHITRISNNAGDDNMWLVYFSHSPQCEERGSVCLSEFIFDTNHWGADSIEWAFQVTLSWVTPEGVPTDTSYRIFVLLGVFIIFMGYLLRWEFVCVRNKS